MRSVPEYSYANPPPLNSFVADTTSGSATLISGGTNVNGVIISGTVIMKAGSDFLEDCSVSFGPITVAAGVAVTNVFTSSSAADTGTLQVGGNVVARTAKSGADSSVVEMAYRLL